MAGTLRARSAAVACALLLLAGAVAAVADASGSARSITFKVRVDRNLNGAVWLLSTNDDAAQLHSLPLREGVVRDWRRPLLITVPMAQARRSTSNRFVITFARLVDRTHAYVATATVGLTRGNLLAGGTVDLGKRTGRLTEVKPCRRDRCWIRGRD
jgi:hypothetical protein